VPTWIDLWGVPIRVSEERLAHLNDEHPEMVGQESLIVETLAEPDAVVQSQSDPDVRLYHRLYSHPVVGDKYMLVVVKWLSEDSFLLTAHFTDGVKRGATLWKRP
jgi:hypothetical protein